MEEEEEGSVAQSVRSPSPVALNRQSPTPDLVNTDGTLLLFPGNSCSRTGLVCLKFLVVCDFTTCAFSKKHDKTALD